MENYEDPVKTRILELWQIAQHQGINNGYDFMMWVMRHLNAS